MNKLNKALIVAALVSFSGTAFADFVTFRSPSAATGYQGLNSAGASLTDSAAGTYRFEAGIFDAGFDPAAPFGDWEANFTAAGGGTWGTAGPTAGRVNTTFNSAAEFTGEQAFVWGFNNTIDRTDPANEWVVLTNESWIFPVHDPLALETRPENQWEFTDEGTVVFGDMGELLNGGAEGFQMQAIPEPSTYALIFGFGVLGLVIVRRVRAQK